MQIDVGDSRFNAIFENPMYNIDPTAPQYKKTKAMDTLLEEKAHRRKQKGRSNRGDDIVQEKSHAKTTAHSVKVPAITSQEHAKRRGKDIALTSLVKSVKSKTQTLHSRKSKNLTS